MKTNLLKHLLLGALFTLTVFSVRAQDEQGLIRILRGSASAVDKCEACKKLRLVGTAESVPALARLLTDERVSQAARYTLEAMPASEAGAALRDALSNTSGLLKSGVVDSLGWRRDTEAVPLLIPLLSDADTAIASASALGRIGGKEALAALEAARANAAPTVRPSVLESLMRCAERALAEGDLSGARRVFNSLAATTEAEHVRVAAQAGLIRAAEGDALKQIQSALESQDSAAQTAALQLAGQLRDPQATQTFADLLPKSSPALQVALLALLQERGDASALPVVLAAARGTNSAVRTGAFSALGELGDVSVVATLAEAATSLNTAEQTAARQALVVLHRGDIASALVAKLPAASPAVQVELVRALTSRSDESGVPALLQLARGDKSTARKAALQALGRLADGSHLGALVQLLAAAKDQDARNEVRSVFELLIERTGATDSLNVTPIVRALDNSDIETRRALFQVSALLADGRLRKAFRSALKDGDEHVRSAAARALCDTRDAELLPDLLELARQTSEPTLRALAFEGSVRLAADEDAKLSTSQRTEALAKVFGLASRVQDKRMLLSGLARVPNLATLKLAEQAGDAAEVKVEAELASLQIAQKLASAEFEAVEPTLARLAASAVHPPVKASAQALLKKMNSGWLFAGPYRQEGKEATALFDTVFEPERADAATVRWRRAPGSIELSRPGEVDLAGIVGGNHCVVYLKTRLYSPRPQQVWFSIGADDGIKLWVNGEVVHSNNAVRGLTPDQDKAKGRLRQGWNDVLAKITQHTAGCGMTFRVTDQDGKDVAGLRLDPHGGLTRRAR